MQPINGVGATRNAGNVAVKYKFDVKRKKYNYKTVIECVKDVKYIYWVKKDLFGCFRIEETVTTTMKQVWRREE